MREMKDSGVNYLGLIPHDWEIVKLKYLTTVRNETDIFNPECDLYIGLENIASYSNEIISTETNYEMSLQRLCKEGDVMFGKLRPYLAKVIISPVNGFCTSELLIFSEFCGDSSFLRYCLLNKCLLDDIDSSTYGAKMPRADTAYILNLAIAVPAIDHQRCIAAFLDTKCAEIDALTADIQSQIDTLEQYKRSVITEAVTKGLNPDAEMKDSGQEWVGMVPISWEMYRGKYLFVQRNMRGNLIELQLLSPTQKFGVVPQSLYEKLSGMNAVKLNEKADLSLLKTIHKGDFCISLRSFQGGFEYSEYEGVVSPAYQVFFPIAAIADGYYRYLFKENGFIDKMNSYTMTLRDGKNIAFADFGNTYIPYPPVKEQVAISNFLDTKCAKIDSAITDKKKQLEILDKYKKSLIFEYVTGKKEVPAS
ncbi:MAG: restriction endonuclease subunit S [Oxalobacter formigenes]|nr:restriction endonuclease subunit S [Oxalobacter formigenes]